MGYPVLGIRRFALSLVIVGFLFVGLWGCDKINNLLNPKKEESGKGFLPESVKVKGTIIAKVNNIPITLEDLQEEIKAYNNLVPADKPELKITTREQEISYLKTEMVRRTLLYQEAVDRGLERDPEVVDALNKTKMDLLVVKLVRQEADKIDVSSKEIEEYYNTYKEQLKTPEERKIPEIVVATEQEAKDILIQLLQGADFAAMARQHSKAASAQQGGDLGFISKGKQSPQFDAVAFSDSLEVGKISNIFKGPDGYYILKLEETRGGKQKSLSDMWDDIKRGLTFLKQQQKIDGLIGELSRKFKIEVYEGLVK